MKINIISLIILLLNVKIITPLKTLWFNTYKIEKIDYIVYGYKLRYVIDILRNRMELNNFTFVENKKIRKNLLKLKFTHKFKKSNATIFLKKISDHKVQIKCEIQQGDKNVSFNENFLQSKKDNTGFDIYDIPRPHKGIRLISLVTSDKKNEFSNIIYKSKLPMKKLAKYYFLQMKKYNWHPIFEEKFFKTQKGFWMIFKKQNKTCLISIFYLKEVNSNLISIYYGYK